MTDETNTTPGPWTWHGDELLSPTEFIMATKKGSGPNDNDARLIVAAPTMLKALKGIRANLVRLAWEENSVMIQGIDKAIHEAEGLLK